MPLNPWLKEKLKYRITKHNSGNDLKLNIIVEVPADKEYEALSILKRLNVKIISEKISRTPKRIFIPVTVPSAEIIDDIEKKLPYATIHYDMPVTIYMGLSLPGLPANIGLELLKKFDPLLGEVRVSKVEVPGLPDITTFIKPAFLPLKRPDVDIVPTSETAKIVEVPEPKLYKNTTFKVAVIDTGATPIHPQLLRLVVERYTTVPEFPDDGMSHGMWCHTTAFGDYFPLTPFGATRGIFTAKYSIHVKALTTAGFGSTSSVLKAMEIAVEKGAKVISMSLGGPQQGPVDIDPQCIFIKDTVETYKDVIFVVAAGNSGPGEWTIASPGVCPYALTVGAYAHVDEDIAYYSSRGPQGKWYKEHKSDFEEDYRKYGDYLIKPDIVAPGGGRKSSKIKPDLVLYSGVTGWFDGFYDGAVNMFEGMKGTSMATPHAAGVVALAKFGGFIQTVFDIKKKVKTKEKKVDWGWGILTFTKLKI